MMKILLNAVLIIFITVFADDEDDIIPENKLAEEYNNEIDITAMNLFSKDLPVKQSILRTTSNVTNLEYLEDVKIFLDENKIATIGFFKNKESNEAKAVVAVANVLKKFAFGIATDDEIFSKYEANDGDLILFKPFDFNRSVYEGNFELDDIKKFVQTESLPLFVEFNHESAPRIFDRSIKLHLRFFVSKLAGHEKIYIDPLKELAKLHRQNILFMMISSDEIALRGTLKHFDVSMEEIPTYRLIDFNEGAKVYKPETIDLSVSAVKEFLEKFFNGELKRSLTLKDLPKNWNKRPVKQLIAKNFADVALDVNKDVLVKFYTTWSYGHKKLSLIFDRLGEKYKHNKSVVIAKMDVMANDLASTKTTIYPKIKLYRKGDNKVINYDYDHTLESFVKFLEAGGDTEKLEKEREAFLKDEL